MVDSKIYKKYNYYYYFLKIIIFKIFKNLYIGRSTFTFHYRVKDIKRAQEQKISGARNSLTSYNFPTQAKMNKGKKPTMYLFLSDLKDSLKILSQYRLKLDWFFIS